MFDKIPQDEALPQFKEDDQICEIVETDGLTIASYSTIVENIEKLTHSEVDLHEDLRKLKVIAGAPELYPEIVASNSVPSIVNFLSHENADIANDVVQLLQVLIDEDAVEENNDPARMLVNALVESENKSSEELKKRTREQNCGKKQMAEEETKEKEETQEKEEEVSTITFSQTKDEESPEITFSAVSDSVENNGTANLLEDENLTPPRINTTALVDENLSAFPELINHPDGLAIPENSAHNTGDSLAERWPGWPGDCVFRMIVPVSKVGAIIGRKGDFIKKMCEETGARIKVLDGPVTTPDCVVLISGKEEPEAYMSPATDAALRVFRRVASFPDNDDDVQNTGSAFCSVRLLVTSTQAINLIGKPRSLIKSIVESSGAMIHILSEEETPFYAAQDERVVDMQGEALKILKALEAIVGHLRKFLVDHTVVPLFEKQYLARVSLARQEEPLADNKSSLHTLSPNVFDYDLTLLGRKEPLFLDLVLSARQSPGLTQLSAAFVTQVSQTMQIPFFYAEDIIGLEGANIAYNRRRSGSTITIQESPHPDQITVDIKGTSSQVQTAEQLIQEFISNYKKPNSKGNMSAKPAESIEKCQSQESVITVDALAYDSAVENGAKIESNIKKNDSLEPEMKNTEGESFKEDKETNSSNAGGKRIAKDVNFDVSESIVIIGFGQMGQVLANFLSTPLVRDSDLVRWPYIGFDLNPAVVKESRKLGFPILYGEGSRPSVLISAGVSSPKAIMIMYKAKKRTTEGVEKLCLAFPGCLIYARAQDLPHLLELKKAGVTDAILENVETSLQLGSKLLRGFGVMSHDVSFLSKVFRDSMEIQVQEEITATKSNACFKPMQMKASDINAGLKSMQMKASDINADLITNFFSDP